MKIYATDGSILDLPAAGSIIGRAGRLPWRVTPLAVKPYPGLWCFNPSIHRDRVTGLYRCTIRCADYGMPGGVQIRGPEAMPHGGVQSRTVMVHLDPTTWRAVEIFPMQELDGLPRNKAANRGYEDMRLYWTEAGGLQAIAAAAHLERTGLAGDTYPPEQVVLTLDARYNIVGATPIRGRAWGGPQKNWSPFDGADEPRFLYSIDRGIVFGLAGPVDGKMPNELAATDEPAKTTGPLKRPPRAAGPASNSEVRAAPQAHNLTPTITPGRSRFSGLRGGTQLLHVGGDQWLGLGHEMMLLRNRKMYWHAFYMVDANGQITHMSPRMKLAPEGIEFAAGMAIDGDRLVISMGIDDAECRIGETSLAAVLGLLAPYVAPPPDAPPKRAQTGILRRDVDPSPHPRRPPTQRTGIGYRPLRGPKAT